MFALSRDGKGTWHLFIDGQEVAAVPAEYTEQSDELRIVCGAARDPSGLSGDAGAVDFSGELFEVASWEGFTMSWEHFVGQLAIPAPSTHVKAESFCPRAAFSPWAELREKMTNVLACVASPRCRVPQAAYRVVSDLADVIAYRDVSEYEGTCAECPAGFAAALAIICLYAQFDQAADAATVNGMLRIIVSNMPPVTNGLEPTFGSSMPLPMVRELKDLAHRRMVGILNLPAGRHSRTDRPSCLRTSTNASIADPLLPQGLCIHVWHDGNAPLAFLRNAVESLSTGGLLTANAELLVTIDACGAPWQDLSTPNGWYLAWLRQRFAANLTCGRAVSRCSGRSAVMLQLSTAWHLLPLRPAAAAERLRAAAKLLESSGGAIAAVSMSEKALHTVAGVGGALKSVLRNAARMALTRQDALALALASPSLGRDWNLTAAAEVAFRIQALSAPAQPSGSWTAFEEAIRELRPCASDQDFLCVPAEVWSADFSPSSDEVWLVRRRPAPGPAAAVALSRGLFHHAQGAHYDPTPAVESLGFPDCFACHLVPPGDDFTVYWVPLDVIGPCRELFSNLLLDTLESLQLASLQGPHSVVVEPFISNAVWQRYSKKEADELHASGKATSIYSFWNKATACGLRHGSATRFSDLFDWQALVGWLRRARGIRGGTSWRSFLAETNGTLDMLAMLSNHPGQTEGAKIPCAESDEPLRLRFFEDDLLVRRRMCVRSTAKEHEGGFELRFLDAQRLEAASKLAVERARAEGRKWAAVGLFLYWIEGAERARLHPARYGKLSAHNKYASIWQGVRFAPGVAQRAAAAMSRLGLCGQRFLAAHWRRGDWFLGPHPRKLEQAALAEAPRFAAVLRRHLGEQQLDRVFLMTNAPFRGADVQALAAELPGITVVQAPVLRGDRESLRQLCIEMAVASSADFFVAFGDGVVQGMASMPSLLVLQMRLHAEAWPLESNAFSFVSRYQDALGI